MSNAQTPLMNLTTVLTVHETSKSKRIGGLDASEVSQFAIKPGQYGREISSANDFID